MRASSTDKFLVGSTELCVATQMIKFIIEIPELAKTRLEHLNTISLLSHILVGKHQKTISALDL